MARVFLSHSSRDSASARWIADWLKEQGFEAPFLDFDKHAGIPPGADWERTLYREIAASQALLIVLSANWNASRWCFAEFTQARALGKPIFQLVGVPPDLSAAENLAPISPDLQQLDLSSDREAALASLAAQLQALALDDRGGFAWDGRRPPYPGLLAFEQDDAAIYFGREPEIRDLIERLQALRIQGGGRLLVLLGASGVGKSSLLRAGVLPRLARSGGLWLPLLPFRPQVAPCEGLARVLALALGDGQQWEAIEARLSQAEARHDLARTLEHLAAELRAACGAPDAQILISVDQGEELFARSDPVQLQRFASILSAALAAGSSFQAVITLRSDAFAALQAVVQGVPMVGMGLPPLARERMAEIITGPARVVGFEVEDAFVQAAIHDAQTEDALPLLAFALREIHERFGADRLLSLSDYRGLGDGQLSPLENAVRQAADDVVALTQPSDEEMGALREAFVPALVRVNDRGDYIRHPARWDSLPPLARPMLSRLVQARLLTLEQREDERWVEVAHEALLRKWPLLRRWLDEASEFLVGIQQLEPDLRDWQQAMGPQKHAALLSGLKLQRAQIWLRERPSQIPLALRAFIQASLEHHEQLARRRGRLRRSVLAGLGLLTLMTTSAWGWAEWKGWKAYQADTRQFLSVHLLLKDTRPITSLINGLAAMNRLQRSMPEAIPLALTLDRVAHTSIFKAEFATQQREILSLAETPSGRLLSGARDGSVQFWTAGRLPDGAALQTDHRSGVRGLVVVDERRWWSAGEEGSLQLWEGRLRRGAPIISGHPSLQAMVRDRDGALITAGTDGSLRRWHGLTGRSLGPPLRSGQGEVLSVAVLPDGDWISGDGDGTLQWWHRGRPRGVPLPGSQGALSDLGTRTDGSFVSVGDDGSIRLRDQAGRPLITWQTENSIFEALLLRRDGTVLSGGREIQFNGRPNYLKVWEMSNKLDHHQIRLGSSIALTIVELPNGDLFTGNAEGVLQRWRGGRRISDPIQTDHGPIQALTLNSFGDLVSGGQDGWVRVWRDGRQALAFATGQSGVTSLLALPRRLLVTGGRDGTIRIWSETGQAIAGGTIQTHQGAVWTMAILPNGDYLTGGDNGRLHRWHRGRLAEVLQTPHNSVTSVVIRPDGTWVTAGDGGYLQFWRRGQPIGARFQTGYGKIWQLIRRRHGGLISVNGDATIRFYPEVQHAIAVACQQIRNKPEFEASQDQAYLEALQLCSRQAQPGRSSSRP